MLFRTDDIDHNQMTFPKAEVLTILEFLPNKMLMSTAGGTLSIVHDWVVVRKIAEAN